MDIGSSNRRDRSVAVYAAELGSGGSPGGGNANGHVSQTIDALIDQAVAAGHDPTLVKLLLQINTVGDIRFILDYFLQTQNKFFKVPKHISDGLGIRCRYSRYHDAAMTRIMDLIASREWNWAIHSFRSLLFNGYAANYLIMPKYRMPDVHHKIGTSNFDKWYEEQIKMIDAHSKGYITPKILALALIQRFIIEKVDVEHHFLQRRDRFNKYNAINYRDEEGKAATLIGIKRGLSSASEDQINMLINYKKDGYYDKKHNNTNWFIVHSDTVIEVIPRFGTIPIILNMNIKSPNYRNGNGWICKSADDAIDAIGQFIIDINDSDTYNNRLLEVLGDLGKEVGYKNKLPLQNKTMS